MYVTFYSYKGGVGRTMALANTACLLAQDEEYPQRVLLWDLDLEAPGLHRLFDLEAENLVGFVDLAFSAASSPNDSFDVGRYIYPTAIDGVDVLPAGNVSPEYCDKLQRINWPGFLTSNPTERGLFFDELIRQISERKYDYVLIDSRTGLNDQAGIATQILPDLVLMIFRLTDQNLDGVTHVCQVTKSQLTRRNREQVEILPIASMVISKSMGEQDKWRSAVRDLFGEEATNYIRFDADLISDERLFCRNDVEIWPRPPIVDDYRRLCEEIRQRNANDSKTAFQFFRHNLATGDEAAVSKTLHSLIASKPRFKKAWDELFEHSGFLRQRLESFDELTTTILAADSTNAFAHEWKACRFLADAVESTNCEVDKKATLSSAEQSLKLAIECDATNARLFSRMAQIHSAVGDLSGSCNDIKAALSLSPESVGLRLNLAKLYVRRGRDYFVSARELLREIESDSKYPLLAYIDSFLLAEKADSTALQPIQKLEIDWHRKQQVIAHCLALQSKTDQARDCADAAFSSVENPPDAGDLNNWAELYMCIEEYERVFDILKGKSFSKVESGVHPLVTLATYLQSRGKKSSVEKVMAAWRGNYAVWNFTELLLFRERLIRDGDTSYEPCLGVFELILRESSLYRLSDFDPVFLAEQSFRTGRVFVRSSRVSRHF